ncbi:MAG: twin-arginine translocation signal domain-containing protein, partial [Sphingomonadales bacterium]|nr:twin-arginine translocation signal domain-containing protein [Sphingomonadales bacterium]
MLDRRSVLKMGSAGLLCGLAGGALPFQALAKVG